MPTLSECLGKSKLHPGIKTYIKSKARNSNPAKAIDELMAAVDGNIENLIKARDDAKKAVVKTKKKVVKKVEAVDKPAEQGKQVKEEDENVLKKPKPGQRRGIISNGEHKAPVENIEQ